MSCISRNINIDDPNLIVDHKKAETTIMDLCPWLLYGSIHEGLQVSNNNSTCSALNSDANKMKDHLHAHLLFEVKETFRVIGWMRCKEEESLKVHWIFKWRQQQQKKLNHLLRVEAHKLWIYYFISNRKQ